MAFEPSPIVMTMASPEGVVRSNGNDGTPWAIQKVQVLVTAVPASVLPFLATIPLARWTFASPSWSIPQATLKFDPVGLPPNDALRRELNLVGTAAITINVTYGVGAGAGGPTLLVTMNR